jgi:hypothetical protein
LNSLATGAYLGAAPLVSSKDILGSAASIMATEARQSSFTNSVLGNNAFSSAFETSISIEQVVTIVTPFIADLPQGTVLDALGFNSQQLGFQDISLSPFQEVSSNDKLNFSYQGGQEITPPSGQDNLYCAFTYGGSSYYTQFVPSQGCDIDQSLSVGSVALVQITVSESIDISEVVSGSQFITII